MALPLGAMRAFVAVADQRGFSRAAVALNLSQPAVSKAVMTLEHHIGMPLFERAARSVSLTEAGAALYERARELFAVEQTAEEELRALQGLERGVLRIGASTTIATYLLPPLLGEFSQRHPAIVLRVTSGNTRAIARLLRQRRLDVGLVEGPVEHAQLEVIPWRQDELIVIAPPGHRLAPAPPGAGAARARRGRGKSTSRVTASAVMAEPFIMRERGSGTRAVAESALIDRGLRIRVALTLDTTEAVKQAVAAGLGLALVSRAAVADQLALGRVVQVHVADLLVHRTLTRLRVRDRAVSAAAVSFEQMLDRDTTDQGPESGNVPGRTAH